MGTDRGGHLTFRVIPDHIAGRPEVRDVGLQFVMDLHIATLIQRHTNPLQPDAVGVWLAPCGNEQFLRGEFSDPV